MCKMGQTVLWSTVVVRIRVWPTKHTFPLRAAQWHKEVSLRSVLLLKPTMTFPGELLVMVCYLYVSQSLYFSR